MRIAVLGAGNVGKTLARAWIASEHEVVLGVRRPDVQATQLHADVGAAVRVATVTAAAEPADVVVLATPWPATEEVVRQAGDLSGKIVVDCTNPVTADFSSLTLGFNTSGAEQVAAWARGASVFKAFNQTGFNVMASPAFGGVRSVMFVCGDDERRKPHALQLVADVGFEAVDAGGLVQARLLEPLAMLWINLALRQGLGRDFAFAIVRR